MQAQSRENPLQSRATSPIPVIIIGGFLGAGKTSLLNHILSENHGIQAGVLVNDFGATNIDAKLVVGVEGETIELANGCVCCTIREDLIAACLQLLQRSNPPDILIIETSGVSNPVEVVRTFDLPELQPALTIDSLVAVVDAEGFASLLEGEVAEIAHVQILAADIVVLNKVDLVDAEQLHTVRALVQKIAPRSRLLETSHGKAPLSAVLGAAGVTAGDQRRAMSTHHQERHARGTDDHTHPFSTWHWTSDRPLSLTRLRAVVETLPQTVYRAKGIVYLEELPSYQVVFQMVGKRYNFRETRLWGADSPQSEIVLIAARGGIDGDELQRAFDECIGSGDESLSPMLRLARRLGLSE